MRVAVQLQTFLKLQLPISFSTLPFRKSSRFIFKHRRRCAHPPTRTGSCVGSSCAPCAVRQAAGLSRTTPRLQPGGGYRRSRWSTCDSRADRSATEWTRVGHGQKTARTQGIASTARSPSAFQRWSTSTPRHRRCGLSRRRGGHPSSPELGASF